ncbi:DNA adenine methylase [Elizabethkingia anophelis]|nr:DNA adenine methylase [Elizabethkingia anophelis]
MIKQISTEITKDIKPFLRWAGGKRWFVKYLEELNTLNINNYFEPFVGGGSVFFSLNNYENAFISDLNPQLIETYEAVRDSPLKVISFLKMFENTEEEYYKIRAINYKSKIERAAQFIYLNQTSFNGIYRVNREGVFNVPYGRRNKKDIIEESNLMKISKKLHEVKINCCDFESLLPLINQGDLIFLDPPYTVAHENNGFIQYNQKIFSLEDQYRLAKFIEIIKDKGAYFILTNAKHDAILDIYQNIGEPVSLSRSSTVGGVGAKRGKKGFNEYIYSNCLKFTK